MPGALLQPRVTDFSTTAISGLPSFTVPPGLNALRVAVNATASGTSLHLTVDSMEEPGLCDQQTDDTAVSCEFSAPPTGAWKLTVSGLAWQEYQVVATSF